MWDQDFAARGSAMAFALALLCLTISPGAAMAQEPAVQAPATDAPPRVLSTAEVVEKCDPSIAVIRGKASFGTGFLVGENVLATNAHVIEGEFIQNVEVRFPAAPDGQQGPFTVELLYDDPEGDLALLAVKVPLSPLEIAKSFRFRKGEDVTLIGSPGLGYDGKVLENAVTRGVLSTETKLADKKFYQLGATINPGNSGGPVIDSTGRVIGIATLKAVKQEALAFCLPSSDLVAALERQAKLSETELAQLRSQHRVTTSIQLLGIAGPMHALALDVVVASPRERSKVQSLLGELDKKLLYKLQDEATAAAADTNIDEDLRQNMTKLVDAYVKLRELSDATMTSSPIDTAGVRKKIRPLKKDFLEILMTVTQSQKLEVFESLVEFLKSDGLPSNGPPPIIVLQQPQPGTGMPARDLLRPTPRYPSVPQPYVRDPRPYVPNPNIRNPYAPNPQPNIPGRPYVPRPGQPIRPGFPR